MSTMTTLVALIVGATTVSGSFLWLEHVVARDMFLAILPVSGVAAALADRLRRS